MNQLAKHIRSFETLRCVILRTLQEIQISKTELIYIADLSEMKYANRMARPETWTIDEIEKLAKYLQYNFSVIQNIRELAYFLYDFPKEEQKVILRAARLDRKKLLIRLKDYNRWKPDELQKMTRVLEEFENQKKSANI